MTRWNDELGLGLEEIDNQHRELFRRMETLLAACVAGKAAEEVIGMLAFLDDYVAVHFRTEEELQERFAYPGLPFHRQQHDLFRRRLLLLKEEVAVKGGGSDVALQVNQMLIDWLRDHILSVDKQTALYLSPRLP